MAIKYPTVKNPWVAADDFVMHVRLVALSLVFAAASFASDGDPDKSAAPATPVGLPMIDWSPAQNLPTWLSLGGQIRGRFEEPSGTSLAKNVGDGYYASRLRISLGVQPTSWLRFYAEAQDARTAGYNSPIAPTTLYNPLDVRQLYFSVGQKKDGAMSWSFRGGRQDLSFGGERLIGPADWGMSRTFDALDMTVYQGPVKVDLFAGSAVLIDDTRLDRHKPGEHFYGAYGSWKNPLPYLNVEPYLLFKQNLLIKSENGQLGNALVTSPGLRAFGTLPGRVDYIGEAILQVGSYSADKVKAHASSGVLGWTVVDVRWKPRVSVEYSYASGDAANKDGIRGTFDQFYPSNHGYYGMIDQFGWKNLKNFRTGFDVQLISKLKLRTDYNDFNLASVQDSLYGSSGTSVVLNRKASSAHIGNEINTVGLYQYSKIWKFGAGFGHLYAGDYLKQAKADFGYTYPYVMLVGSF
jgi:hypothetical protein